MREDKGLRKILSFLRKGDYVSGEAISSYLSISRTSVWKKVKKLQSYGYEILSSPRLGYKLVKVPDLLLPLEIRRALKTKKFGQNIYHFLEIDSTINVARKLAESGESEGTVVVAEAQKAGKGRLSRSWISPFGGIWISLLLYPPFSPQEAFRLTIIAALSLVEILRELGIEARIKWPNDILIGGKKVAGILTEIEGELDKINYAILSVGINANISLKRFPKELRGGVTTIKEELGRNIDRVEFLKRLFKELEKNYILLKEGKFESIFGKWRKYLDTLGKEVTVKLLDREISGKAIDVDMDGSLIVKRSSGKIEKIFSGDVIYR